jgi:hypothetical protein
MNAMKSLIFMLSMLAVSADTINIVNNCEADVEISLIYMPTGTGIQCHPMLKLAIEEQATIDDFYPLDDVILIKSSAKTGSTSFTYIDTLHNVMGNEEDIEGQCANLVNSGDVGVYSVQTDVPYLTLCANEPETEDETFAPEPAPAEYTEQTTIVNKCSNDFEFAQIRIQPRINVVCFSTLNIPSGEELSYDHGNAMGYVVIKTTTTKDTPNFQYVGNLQELMDLEGDADGKCQELIKSGYIGVFSSLGPHMTLCA